MSTTAGTSHTHESQHTDVTMTPATPSNGAQSHSTSQSTAAANPSAAATTTAMTDSNATNTSSTTSANPSTTQSSSSTTSASTTSQQPSHADASHSYNGPVRSRNDRMIIKLTTNLMNTYNAINEKYYANKRKRLLEQQAAAAALKAKGGSSAAGAPLLYNDGHDDKDYNYLVQPHEMLANRYIVDHSIGKGSFGRVVKAFDTLTKKYVACKIVKSKSAFYKQAQIELKILMSLQADADKWNIVNVIDQFVHKNHQCIVFELLSLNLYELLRNTRFTGVSLKLIAKFAQQLLCTLGYLGSKERGDKRIIHCDLKPENILLRTCFPVADHQILTEQGFMFVSEIQKQLQEEEEHQQQQPQRRKQQRRVRVACYNASNQSIEYHPISCDDLIIKPGTHRMIQFNAAASQSSSPMHLTVTHDHDMYVRTNMEQPSSEFAKHTAQSLYELQQSNPATPIGFLTRAVNGIAATAKSTPSLPFMHLFAYNSTHSLSSATTVDAFLQLHGFILACTQQQFLPSSSSHDLVLQIPSISIQSVSYLRSLFSQLSWREHHDWMTTSSEEQHINLQILRSDAVHYFHSLLQTNPSSQCLPSWMLHSLAKDQVRCVLRGISRSISCEQAKAESTNNFFTNSPQWREEMLQLLLHAGYSASYSLLPSDSTSSKLCCCPASYSSSSPLCCPSSANSSSSSSRVWQITYHDSSLGPIVKEVNAPQTVVGDVWCVNVPHSDHLIIARKAVLKSPRSPIASQQTNDKTDLASFVSVSAPTIVGNCKKSAIKVIDFGSACFANQKTYTYIQSRFYRAPEVLLGLSYNGAIDMWSLGCILVEMHTGKPLFDGQDEADQMVKQVEILGIPPQHMLEKNRKAEKFFEWSESTRMFRLKKKFNANLGLSLRTSLHSKWENTQLYKEFEDLISCMLIYDPLKRIRPSQALAHPFFAAVASTIAAEGGAVAAATTGSTTSTSAKPDGTSTAAMDTSSPAAAAVDNSATQAVSALAQQQAAQKVAYIQQQQLAAAQSHAAALRHHHHSSSARSGSRKRPHSNPVYGATSTGPYHHHHHHHHHVPIQPLDAHVQQAIAAQSAKAPVRNNLVTDAAAEEAKAAAQKAAEAAKAAAASITASSAAVADSGAAMDEQPDVTSSSIQAPVTPSKHGMVTRSNAATNSAQKRDSLDIGKLAVAPANSTSSSGSSGSSSPDHASTAVTNSNDAAAASSGAVDASTVTTANPSAASSPKVTTTVQSGTSMVDIDSTSSAAFDAAVVPANDGSPAKEGGGSQDPSPSKGGKGSGRKGKKGGSGGARGNKPSSNAANAGNESDSSATSNAMMVDGDSAVGHRTRSHVHN